MNKKNSKNNTVTTEKESKQLSLGLNSPFTNFFTNLKWRITRRLNLFEANTFINDSLIWVFAIFQLIGIFYQLIYILNSLEILPSFLPLFEYNAVAGSYLIPKFYFLLLPVISFLIFSYSFKVSRYYYFKNSLLALYILFVSNIIIITFCLHLIKTLSQYV
jgi:hypothetical protein